MIRFLKSTGSNHIFSCNVLRLSCFYNLTEFLAGKCFQTVIGLFWQNTFLLSFLARTVFYLLICSTKQEMSRRVLNKCGLKMFQQWPWRSQTLSVTRFLYFASLFSFLEKRHYYWTTCLENKQTSKEKSIQASHGSTRQELLKISADTQILACHQIWTIFFSLLIYVVDISWNC